MYQDKLIVKTNIKRLGSNDINSCLQLDLITFNGIWNRKHWERELSDPARICIGLFIKKELIGFSCGWKVLNEINLTLIAIHPSYQRKGLGKQILLYFIDHAKEQKANSITLEIKESNYPAKELYKNFGFKEIAYRPKLYRDGSNAIIYKLSLSDTKKKVKEPI